MRSNFTVEETQAILAKHYPWAVKAEIVMFDSHIHLWRMDRLMREFMGEKVITEAQLLMHIQDALNTEETGSLLIEVARSAHKAELLLAEIYRIAQENEHSQILSQLITEAIDNG